MKIEIQVRFSRTYLFEAVLHIMKRQRYLDSYFFVLAAFSFIYIIERYVQHSHKWSESLLISFGILAVSTTILGLSIFRFNSIEEQIEKIILTDETIIIEFKRLSPILIPWTEIGGYSTTARLLYLRLSLKNPTIGSHLAIPLSDITREAFEVIRARLNPLPLLNKNYYKNQYESRLWGSVAHLSALSMYFTGVGFLLGPLIIWIWKRKSVYVSGEAREALNFNISILIYSIGTALLCVPYFLVSKGDHTVAHGFVDGYVVLGVGIFMLMGFSFLLIVLLFGFHLVCILIAGVTTGFGKPFRYPLNLRLVREGSLDKPLGRVIAVLLCIFLIGGASEICWLSIIKPKRSVPTKQSVDHNKLYDEVSFTNSSIPQPSAGQKWTNELGMKFNPIPGLNVLFGVWDVRVKDYELYLNETCITWSRSTSHQTKDDPVDNVSADDAEDFCKWLTQRDRKSGILSASQYYRLPTDAEWSVAAGGAKYPWGDQWPPPVGAGNYASSLRVDNYEYTSPVGSFPPNKYGLYDMGGNVWQYCDDSDAGKSFKDQRGGSYREDSPFWLLSSFCRPIVPQIGSDGDGFRVVVVVNP